MTTEADDFDRERLVDRAGRLRDTPLPPLADDLPKMLEVYAKVLPADPIGEDDPVKVTLRAAAARIRELEADRCPRCGSTDPAVGLPPCTEVGPDPWHDRPTRAAVHCPTCGQPVWPEKASTRPWCPEARHDH